MDTATELSVRLTDRASVDADFRSRLLSDPKAAVHEELGVEVPDGVAIKVHENDMEDGPRGSACHRPRRRAA